MVEKTQGVTQEKNSRPYTERKQSNKKTHQRCVQYKILWWVM